MTNIKPRLEYRNGKPVLSYKTEDGSDVIISFSETEPDKDVKRSVLDIITSQYKDRLVASSPSR